MSAEVYTVCNDFTPEASDQVKLTEGDSVSVLVKKDTGWWLVKTDDCQGWVPATHLHSQLKGREDQVIKYPKGMEEKFMVVKSYKSDLKDEVTLHMGSVVEVVEKTMDGWWLVRCKGKEGRAPATNMRRANTAKAQHILEISSQATLEAQMKQAQRSKSPPKPSSKKSKKNKKEEEKKAKKSLPDVVPSEADDYDEVLPPPPRRQEKKRQGAQKKPRKPSGESFRRSEEESRRPSGEPSRRSGEGSRRPEEGSRRPSGDPSRRPEDRRPSGEPSRRPEDRRPSGEPSRRPEEKSRRPSGEPSRRSGDRRPSGEPPRRSGDRRPSGESSDRKRRPGAPQKNPLQQEEYRSIQMLESVISLSEAENINNNSSHSQNMTLDAKEDNKGEGQETTVTTPPSPPQHFTKNPNRTAKDTQHVKFKNVIDNRKNDNEEEEEENEHKTLSQQNSDISRTYENFTLARKEGRPIYAVRANYRACEDTEVDLIADELVVVMEKTGTGWWYVQAKSGTGWAPNHFLKVPTGLMDENPHVAEEKQIQHLERLKDREPAQSTCSAAHKMDQHAPKHTVRHVVKGRPKLIRDGIPATVCPSDFKDNADKDENSDVGKSVSELRRMFSSKFGK